MRESVLLTGTLEPTNEPYAVAKIAGIKLCESYNRQHGRDYRSIMPTNLYGVGDNYHPENSHVIPALIRRLMSALRRADLLARGPAAKKALPFVVAVDHRPRAADVQALARPAQAPQQAALF